MKDAAFQELQAFVRLARFGAEPGGRLEQARSAPRTSRLSGLRSGASQAEFALMIGISVATSELEPGQRRRTVPPLALLRVAARSPKAVSQPLPTERGAA